MTTDIKETETRSFEADVARLLNMIVHSVYSDRDVFLRWLTSNGAVDVQLGRGDGDTDGSCTKGQGDRERPRPVSQFLDFAFRFHIRASAGGRDIDTMMRHRPTVA